MRRGRILWYFFPQIVSKRVTLTQAADQAELRGFHHLNAPRLSGITVDYIGVQE